MNNLIIDGYGLVFRSHFAFSTLRTSNGTLSGCVYGFLTSLGTLKKRFSDFHVTIAWDNNAVRKKASFPFYKSERPRFRMGEQISDLKSMFSYLNVSQAECPGEEADDVIATLVRRYEIDGQVYIYSSDKDLMQLVRNGKVIMIRPSSGHNSEKFYDEEAVKRDFGVAPKNIPCYQAFRGDPVDSVPGLARVRSSLIIRLVEVYKTPQEIYANLSKEKLSDFEHQSFKAFEKQSEINYGLTCLRTDLDLVLTNGVTDKQRFKLYLDKYEIKKISSDSYAGLFENESHFLSRTAPSLELPSLFE